MFFPIAIKRDFLVVMIVNSDLSGLKVTLLTVTLLCEGGMGVVYYSIFVFRLFNCFKKIKTYFACPAFGLVIAR